MKYRISGGVLGLSIVLLIGGCATVKTQLPTNNIDELVGTWANPENNVSKSGHDIGKLVFKTDKTADFYANADSEKSYILLAVEVEEKWTDRKGAYYFSVYTPGNVAGTFGNFRPYWLFRVSSDGDVLESMFAYNPTVTPEDKMPTQVSPEAADPIFVSYYVWYRQ